MGRTVDYYFAPQSPWTYLGHERFAALVRETGATVRVLPADLGKVFPISGGLPLHKRAPQRQAYRLLELRRFSQALGVPLNPEPRFFPVVADPAARLITAVALRDGTEAAMRLTGAVTSAVWAQERDIADLSVLAALLAETGLSAARLDDSLQPDVQTRYEQQTQAAIDAGVFGAPSYVIEGELFWGQDRLDFVARCLRV
jgi:2-hydroxychromene-2-carboxylate isomerase